MTVMPVAEVIERLQHAALPDQNGAKLPWAALAEQAASHLLAQGAALLKLQQLLRDTETKLSIWQNPGSEA